MMRFPVGTSGVYTTKDTWANVSQSTSANGLDERVLMIITLAFSTVHWWSDRPKMHFSTKCKQDRTLSLQVTSNTKQSWAKAAAQML